jgi:hypothetical protein
VVGGGHNIREENSLLVGDVARDLEKVGVSKEDATVLGLGARESAKELNENV